MNRGVLPLRLESGTATAFVPAVVAAGTVRNTRTGRGAAHTNLSPRKSARSSGHDMRPIYGIVSRVAGASERYINSLMWVRWTFVLYRSASARPKATARAFSGPVRL